MILINAVVFMVHLISARWIDQEIAEAIFIDCRKRCKQRIPFVKKGTEPVILYFTFLLDV